MTENRETRWPSTDDGSIGEHLAEGRAVEAHQERKHAARDIAYQIAVSDKAHAFLSALVASGELNVDDLLLLLEKPWKWQPEYLNWIRQGEAA